MVELLYKIKFYKAEMGKDNEAFTGEMIYYWCVECGEYIKLGETYYYPKEDQEVNEAQFPEEYIICENCGYADYEVIG